MSASKIVMRLVSISFTVLIFLMVVYGLYELGLRSYSYGYRIFAEPPVSEGEGRDRLVQIKNTMSDKDIAALLEEKGLKRSDVVVRTGLDKAYIYQIFAGKKNPSRDKLITIAFGMKLSEEETQRMLQLSGHRELWPKDERDALFLFAIQRGMSLEEIHTELERYGLDSLAAPIK